MRNSIFYAGLAFVLTFSLVPARAQNAATNPPAATARNAAPSLKDPEVADRLADLGAYINNAARANAANTNINPQIGGPGPGHNGFQIICAAVVLFMSLAGLALVYGGLVPRKN